MYIQILSPCKVLCKQVRLLSLLHGLFVITQASYCTKSHVQVTLQCCMWVYAVWHSPPCYLLLQVEADVEVCLTPAPTPTPQTQHLTLHCVTCKVMDRLNTNCEIHYKSIQ